VRLRGRRAGKLGLGLRILRLLGLRLLLREVRSVGVLMVDGGLLMGTGYVGRLGVLLHGYLRRVSIR
jgi:hypothetical protein